MNVQQLMDQVFPTVKQNHAWYDQKTGCGCSIVSLLIEGGSQVVMSLIASGEPFPLDSSDVAEGLREVFGLSEEDAKVLSYITNDGGRTIEEMQEEIREFLTSHTSL